MCTWHSRRTKYQAEANFWQASKNQILGDRGERKIETGRERFDEINEVNTARRKERGSKEALMCWGKGVGDWGLNHWGCDRR